MSTSLDFLLKTSKNNTMNKNPQVIFYWIAPLRPYKKKSSIIIRFYLALSLILSAIVFLFGDKVILLPIWALLFIFYVLTITPPPNIENKITKFGVESDGIIWRWESLSHFYFEKRFGFHILTIVSQPPISYHLYLVVPNEEIKKHLFQILSEHLAYQEKPNKTITEKLAHWLLNLFPEDNSESSNNPPSAVAKPKPATP